MKVVFLEGAHQDLVGSADYFVDIDPRLATRFLDDVEYGVNMFRSSPQNGKMVDEFRLIPLQMFPFNLV